MTWLTVLLALLAAVRVTLLITRDAFPPIVAARAWLLGRSKARSSVMPWWYTLITCPWCLSPYVAAPVTVAAWYWGTREWFIITGLICAASLLTGMVASWLDD